MARVIGRLFLMPWLELTNPIRLGSFEFHQLSASETGALAGDVWPYALKVLTAHRDQQGRPRQAATIALNIREEPRWDISEELQAALWKTAHILAFSCLAEQEFYRPHFAPHMNSAMFQIFGFPVLDGEEYISIEYLRRGTPLRVSGMKISEVTFQQPHQIAHTECGPPNLPLGEALLKAIGIADAFADQLNASIELFLMAQSEAADMDARTSILLNAMAFEKLLVPDQHQTANDLGRILSELWDETPKRLQRRLSETRVKPDSSKYQAEQLSWRVSRKWIKELYESRNSFVHSGLRSELSSNWEAEHHRVIAAFVFPLTVKRLLADRDLYKMTDNDQADRNSLDELLAWDWDLSWEKQPGWARILDKNRRKFLIRQAVEKAADAVGAKNS